MGFDRFIVILILVVAVACLFWLWDRRKNQKRRQALEDWKVDQLSGENVIRAQMEFDQRLDSDVDLPDGIRGKQAYIYRNLMRKWFGDLVAKNRFDEIVASKVRSDWLNYMYLIESQRRLSFLSGETKSPDKRESYGKEAEEERRTFMGIEDAFAAAVGKDAVEQLHLVREEEFDAFDRAGIKEIAPKGFYYFPISINPYVEGLKPRKR